MNVLILEIQKREVLWNKRNSRYKDRHLVDKEWNVVAKNTGFTSDEARKKWRNLQDQFSKELKKIPKSKSGDPQDSVPKYKDKWQYFYMLLFLRDILQPKDTEGNIPQGDTQSLEPNQEDPAEEELSNLPETDVDDAFNNDIPNSPLSTSQVIPHVVAVSDSAPAATSRNKRRNPQDNALNVEKELLKIEAKKLAILERPENDDMLFFKSLLPYFRQMQPIQKLRVRYKFQNVIIQELSAPTHSTAFSFLQSNSSSASTYYGGLSTNDAEYIPSPGCSSNLSSPSREPSAAQYLTGFYPS